MLIAVVGAALAFAANALSSRGLKLSQDYFLTGADNSASQRPAAWAATNRVATMNVPEDVPALISVPRLAEKRLQAIDSAQALRFFHDSRRESELLVFIDARSDDNYRLGHIPDAYELDPYHPEEYLPMMLPVCQRAEIVVVYCTGSDCEDSELSALLLRKAGVPNRKLFVYVGGITEWTDNKFPIQTGAQPAGRFSNAVR